MPSQRWFARVHMTDDYHIYIVVCWLYSGSTVLYLRVNSIQCGIVDDNLYSFLFCILFTFHFAFGAVVSFWFLNQSLLLFNLDLLSSFLCLLELDVLLIELVPLIYQRLCKFSWHLPILNLSCCKVWSLSILKFSRVPLIYSRVKAVLLPICLIISSMSHSWTPLAFFAAFFCLFAILIDSLMACSSSSSSFP